jgi:hypothetical protein
MQMSDTRWKDAKGREWNAQLNLAIVRTLKHDADVDLLDESKATGLALLLTDRERLGVALWIVHRGQCDARRIDQDGFYSGLDADALVAGFGGLAAAFADFCPAPSRESVRRLIELEMVALEQLATMVAEKIQSPEPAEAMNAAVQQTAAEISG